MGLNYSLSVVTSFLGSNDWLFYPLSCRSPACPSLFAVWIRPSTLASLLFPQLQMCHDCAPAHLWSLAPARLSVPSAPIPCLSRSLSLQLQEAQQRPLGPSSGSFSLSHHVCWFDLLQGSFLCSPWSPLLLSWTYLGNECSSSCLNSCWLQLHGPSWSSALILAPPFLHWTEARILAELCKSDSPLICSCPQGTASSSLLLVHSSPPVVDFFFLCLEHSFPILPCLADFYLFIYLNVISWDCFLDFPDSLVAPFAISSQSI